MHQESGFGRNIELNVGCVERMLSGHVCGDFKCVTKDMDMKQGVDWRLHIIWTICLEL